MAFDQRVQTRPLSRVEIVFARGSGLAMIDHVSWGPTERCPPRSEPFECAGELSIGEGGAIGIARKREPQQEIVAASSTKERRRAGVPRDVFIGDQCATRAIARDESVIAHLALRAKHEGNGILE